MTSVRQHTQGSRIRTARLAAGLTQADLAHRIGTRERNIVRWENDQHAPRFAHVADIARATGKDVSFFTVVDDDEEPSRLLSGADMFGTLLGELVVKSPQWKAAIRQELEDAVEARIAEILAGRR